MKQEKIRLIVELLGLCQQLLETTDFDHDDEFSLDIAQKINSIRGQIHRSVRSRYDPNFCLLGKDIVFTALMSTQRHLRYIHIANSLINFVDKVVKKGQNIHQGDL